MSEKESADNIVIHDSADRRRFMRKGAAFVAAAGALSVSASRSVLASDCDRGGPGGEKPEVAGNGSDSDTGENSDPTGCGRNYDDKPKISRLSPGSGSATPKKISVAKILG